MHKERMSLDNHVAAIKSKQEVTDAIKMYANKINCQVRSIKLNWK